jgi:hypothetical protein
VRHPREQYPVFLDLNVYPMIRSLPETGRALGYYGDWHTFDARRLGLPESSGRDLSLDFDEATVALARSRA